MLPQGLPGEGRGPNELWAWRRSGSRGEGCLGGGGPAWAPPAFFCGFPWPGLWRDLCLSAKSITVVGMRAREATCQFCTREA